MDTRMPLSGSNSTAATSADVAARAHNTLDTAVDKAAPTVNRMVDKAHATIDRVAAAATPAAEAVQSAVQKTSDQSARLMESCANSVRAQPLAAIGIAAAVGYLAGRLMR